MEKIKRIASWILKYGVLPWISVASVWYIIVSTLQNGISCDEGYYLLGYLRNQNIEGIGTDFHAIVRAITRQFADDNIMTFRYLRLFLQVFAIVLFAGSSYEWLSRKKGLKISRWIFYPLVLLSGAMSYTFATPTISYDSIEFILILLIASFFFVLFFSDKKVIRSSCAVGIGFLLWFACSNYPPAGVCMVVLFTIAYFLESEHKSWGHFLAALVGLFAAIVCSHFFIHDMKDWFAEISKIFVTTFTEKSMSRHDAGSLVSVMLITLAKVLLLLLPVIVLLTIVYQKIHVTNTLQWFFVLFICIILLVVRQVYNLRGPLFLLPVAVILAKVLAQPEISLKGFLLSKGTFLLLVLVAIPFAGVFGTNQPVLNKAIIFVPFWVLAFFYLSAMLKTEQTNRLLLLYTVILFAGYIWLGNFQRYHYYYTPRSSQFEIVGASRPQKILISQYQQLYYKDLLDTLKSYGCKPGDKYMAFGENQMTVYLAGGYIDGRLPYHWWQYKHFESEAPKAFILFKNEEEGVIDHFRDTGWGFPEQYERMEMRQMSQNMDDEYRTVYFLKR